MTQFIVDNRDQVPTMMACKLGPLDETQVGNLEVIQAAIQSAVNSQACPEGVYTVNGNIFLARSGAVTFQKSAEEGLILLEPTITPTINP
jgi:hypothetical protein